MKTKDYYLHLLERCFENQQTECPAESRLVFLADNIFDFTTYDDGMAEVFGRWAVRVCQAISDGTTFDFIKDSEQYQWYLLMVNMPFFAQRLEWGTSIRGAWWLARKLQSYGLDDGNEQVTELNFSIEEWKLFVDALLDFATVQPAAPLFDGTLPDTEGGSCD